MICGRCGHTNENAANYCSSCGGALRAADDDATLTLAAVTASETDDDLAAYLDGLPAGVGLLVVLRGPSAGSSFRLDAAETTAGRHPDSHIFFDDVTVSRRHATFTRTDHGYEITDVGSLNGTYVNRNRVERAELHHGDEIQIGRYRLTFVLGGHDRER